MINFKSVGHFFATVFEKVLGAVPKVQGAIAAVQGTEATVEAVSMAAGPVYGPAAVSIEKVGYMVLGELAAVLNAGEAAAEAKLKDAGLDITVINTVKAVLANAPQIAVLAKTL